MLFSWEYLGNITESGDYMKTWEELKQEGSEHYQGNSQAIDIYKSKGVFKSFALASICKYAVRNMDKELNPKDITKIIHYSEFLLAENKEKDEENLKSFTEGNVTAAGAYGHGSYTVEDQLKDIVRGKG